MSQEFILADRLSKIKPSTTIAIVNKAKELKEAGKNIISLGAGEPDFDTHATIKEKAYEAIKDGFTKYTTVDGIIDLKRAIIDKFKKDNNIAYDLQEITVGCGGKQVLFNAFYASLNAGDEVIIPVPYWVSYPDMVRMVDGNPILLDTKESNNFKIIAKDLEKVITDRTKWLVLNSPSNPTGSVYTEPELKAIAEVLKKYEHVNIISDDIYEHIIYPGSKFYNILLVAPYLKERVLLVNGVSKAYAMTGWRIGYAGGNKKLIKAMAKIQSQTTSNPCSISQKAAVQALTGDQGYLNERLQAFLERRDFITKFLNDIEAIHCHVPEGAFYIFASCQGLIGKTTKSNKVINNCCDFATYLLEDYLVALVPGIAFGKENFFRISYATSLENLKEACNRIKDAVDSLT